MADVEPKVEVSKVDALVVDELAGVVDGVVEKDDENLDAPVRERIDHAEKVVVEKDKDGNVVGWHKEA